MAVIRQFLHMMDEGDPIGTLFLTIVMLYLGNAAGRVRRSAHKCGAYAAIFVAAFYVIYALAAYGRMEPTCLLGITWRTLLAAGIAYGTVVLATAIASALVAPPAKTLSRWIDRRLQHVSAQLQDRRRRKQYAASQRASDERDERLAPMREQERRDADAAKRRAADIQERRRKLRFDCQLGYNRLRPGVIEMFPQEEFSRLVDDALSAQTEPALCHAVEELMATVEAVVGQTSQGGVESLLEIANDFDERRKAVRNATYSDERKDDLIKYLNIQEAKTIYKELER